LAFLLCEFRPVFTWPGSTLSVALFFFDLEVCSLVTTALVSSGKLQLVLHWACDCI
jgi:hypothetical protein